MEWEKFYIEALIEALHPFGDVLEVGYRSGYAAGKIQKHLPESHTIVEPDALIAKEARKWAEAHHAVVIEEPWQRALPRLAVFDAVYFSSSSTPQRVVQEGNRLLQEVEEQIPELTKMRYADSDLEAFCENSAKGAPEPLFRFLLELEHKGQITEEQREKMIRKFKLKGVESLPSIKKTADDLLPFLNQCLASHMRVGSRFTCFFEDFTSKYEDPRFFDEIIANPYVNFREWTVPIPQKKSAEALVVLVEKLG